MRRAAAMLALQAALLAACAPESAVSDGGRRLVSLHDTTTEIVVGLGRAGELVAVTEPEFLSEGARRSIAGVVRLPAGRVSIEGLLLHRPDLVLGTDVIVELQADLERALDSGDVARMWIDPQGIDGLLGTIEEIGVLLDAQAEAGRWTAELRARIPLGERSADPLRVFFYDCCDPPFTAGGKLPLTELLGKLDGRNIFEHLQQDWAKVAWEAVIAGDPELIVIDDYDANGQLDAAGKLAHLRSLSFLADVPALRRDQFAVLSLGVMLEGPRNFEAVEPLRAAVLRARAAREESQ